MDSKQDVLIPDTQVRKMFSVTSMTLYRWTNDKDLGFPPAIKIRKRNYRSMSALESFRQAREQHGDCQSK